MAKSLNLLGSGLAAVCLWAGLTGNSVAETLPDPTRPPASLHHAAAAAGASDTGLQLQSVLVSPARTVAIINGNTVTAGDRIGDARIVRIMETEVLLRKGQETQTLRLFPNIDKRTMSGVTGSKAGGRTQQVEKKQ